VARIESENEPFDDAQEGHPIGRRLNRIERVSVVHHGVVDLRFDNGMLVTFDLADDAVLAACEMQRRCGALPQVANHKLALRIGIHGGLIRQRSKDESDENAPELVTQLARINDGILISRDIINGLDKDLRRLARPLGETVAGASVFIVDWQRDIPPEARGAKPLRLGSRATRKSPFLHLHLGIKTLEVSEFNPVVAIGRDPTNDLVLASAHVSRNHCRIERTPNDVLLVDTSVNGTLIVAEDKHEMLVKNRSVPLKDKGMIFFGRPFKGERRGGVRYESF
jgi:hypothetical protein